MITNSMKKHLISFSIVICCLSLGTALTSCSDEDYLGGHYTTDGVGTLMNVTAQVKSEMNPDMTWAAGDVIGIATGYGQNDISARNREYACQADGSTFKHTTGYPMYVKGATNIVAYYPFSGSDGAEPTIELNTTDQSDITNYFLAKAEGVNPQNGGQVNLVFTNALSRLDLTIVTPAGESIREYRLSGFVQQATVSPYTMEITMSAPEDLVGKGTDLSNISLTLIPQDAGSNGVPARLVLVGNIRSYSIDMSGTTLKAGAVQRATVDVTNGIGSIDFVPGGSTWSDSGLGGQVNSK